MNYLLDTNAWLQLGQAPTQIPLRVRKILLAENTIALSPISIIEIAQKQSNGRLTLSAPLEEWVSKALFDGLKLLPLTRKSPATPTAFLISTEIPPIASSPPPPAPINSPSSPVIGSSSPRLM